MRLSGARELPRVLRPERAIPPALAVVGGASVILAAYVLGVGSRSGRVLDQQGLRLVESHGAGVQAPVHAVLAYVSPAVVAVGVAVLALKVALRGERGRAAGVAGLVVGSELLTQGLKSVLPRPGGGANTLPSGHVTMIAAFVVALLALAGWRVRPMLLGAAAVAASALGTMIIGWHRPSDVVAACGVVAMCSGAVRLLGFAAELRARRRDQVGALVPTSDQPTVPMAGPGALLASAVPRGSVPQGPRSPLRVRDGWLRHRSGRRRVGRLRSSSDVGARPRRRDVTRCPR